MSDIDDWTRLAASSERSRLAREQVRTQVQAQLAAPGAVTEARAVGLAATQWSRVASPELIAAAAKYGPQLPPGAVAQMMAGAAKKKAGGGGWRGKLAGAVGKVGNAVEWATPDVVGSAVKGTARVATSTLATPVELVGNLGSGLIDAVTNPNSTIKGNPLDILSDAWEGTSGAHMFDKNQGSGWFLGDKAAEDREREKRDIKGVLAVTADGKVISYDPDKTYAPGSLRGTTDPITGAFTPDLMTGTIGRNIGRAIGSDVDDLGYQVMSGLIDTVASVKFDPTNKLGKMAKEARATRATIVPAAEHLDEARAAAGLVDGSRKFVHPQRADEWLTSAQGRAVIDWHTANTDAAEAFRKLGGKVDPAVARNLAEARTADETRAVLNEVLGLDAGLMSTKQLPGAVGTRVGMTRPVAAITSRWERSATERWLDQQGAKVWDDVVMVGANVSRKGKIEAVNAIDNMLATTRVPLEKRNEIVTRMIEGLTDGSQEGILKARNAASMAQYEKYVDAGIPHDFAMVMTRHTGGDDFARLFAMDSLANADDFGLVMTVNARETAEALANGQMALPGLEAVDLRAVGPLGLSDGWSGLMEMPDARQIKSIINPLGRIWSIGVFDPDEASIFNRAAQKLHAKKGVNAARVRELLASGDPDDAIAASSMLEMIGAPRLVPAALDFVQSKVWKPTVVMRVATVLRVVGEEQARLAEEGLVSSFNHPLQFISLASNHSVIGGLDIAGGTFNTKLLAMLDDDDAAEAIESYIAALAKGKPVKHFQDVGERTRARMARTAAMQTPSKIDHPDQWVDGLAGEMRRYWRDPSFQLAARAMISDEGYDAVKLASALMTDEANKSAWRYLVDLGKSGIPVQAEDGTRVIRKIDFENPDNVIAYFETTIPGRLKSLVGDNETLLRAIAHGKLGEIEQTIDNKSLTVLNRVVSRHEVGGFGSGKTRPGWVGSDVYHPTYGRGVVTNEAANGQSVVMFEGSAWAGGKPTAELRAAIEDWRAHPASPLRTKRPVNYVQAASAKDSTGRAIRDAHAAAVDMFFNQLWGGTTDKLSRSPAFRQFYYAKVADLLPYLDPAEANKVIKTMEAAGAGKFLAPDVLDRVVAAAKKANGKFTAKELDGYAKDHALGKVKGLLYDSSEKSQLADSLRLVFPFAEAWKEVLTRQTRLIAANPAIINTVRKGVVAAEQTGMMREDANGRWVFAYPGSAALVRALTGQDGAMLAQAQGLNIGFSVIPGMGPVMQIGMSKVLPDVPEYDWIRDIVTPYGERTAVEAFTPSWLSKVWAGLDGDETGQTAYATQLSEVIRVLASSGRYGNDLADSERMIDDAKSQARWLTVFRGLAQAVVPSAPYYDFKIAGKVDAWSSAFAQEYGKLYEEDPTTATERFLNLYGDMAAAYVIGKTRATVEGIPFDATKDFTDWQRNNPGLVRSYPDLAGYFAPSTGAPDDTAFQRQLDDGTRVRRSPEEQVQAINSVIAKKRLDEYVAPINKAVDDLVASLPPSNKRSTEQQQALNETRNQAKLAIDEYKAQLEKEYLGFEASPKIEIGYVQNQIGTLRQAIADDRLEGNPTRATAIEYLKVRDAAVDALRKVGASKPDFGGGLLAKGHEEVAAALRRTGEYYAKQDAGFARMWDDFLSKEVTE